MKIDGKRNFYTYRKFAIQQQNGLWEIYAIVNGEFEHTMYGLQTLKQAMRVIDNNVKLKARYPQNY